MGRQQGIGMALDMDDESKCKAIDTAEGTSPSARRKEREKDKEKERVRERELARRRSNTWDANKPKVRIVRVLLLTSSLFFSLSLCVICASVLFRMCEYRCHTGLSDNCIYTPLIQHLNISFQCVVRR